MNLSLALLDLAGYVALLLWGVHMVQSGVQRALGQRLRGLLSAAVGSRWTGFAAGLGVTAVLQSSTATGLMVGSFAAAGLIELTPALGVMLGANVGTTLIVQLLSVDVTKAAPALVLLGVALFRRAEQGRWRDLGRAAIGLGLVLLALSLLVGLVEPLRRSAGMHAAAEALAGQPVFALLLAAALAWAAHSSAAVVLLVMSFAEGGALPIPLALAMVLGANLGTAINPCLEVAAGSDAASRRVPAGNLGTRILGCALALPFLPAIAGALEAAIPDPAHAIAAAHSFFNLILAAVFLPVLPGYAALLRRLLPDRRHEDDPSTPVYLAEESRGAPVVAIGNAAREALRLADVLERMLRGVLAALAAPDRKAIAATKQMDDVLDALNAAIKRYVTALDPAAMSEADRRRAEEVLAFATNMEQAGDVVERNVLQHLSKMQKRGLSFSAEGREELSDMILRLIGNLRAAATVFLSDDPRAARLLAAEKAAFRDLESAATAAHFARLRAGRAQTVETSALHLDLVRDLKRVNAHLVAGAAYPVLESQGGLLSSRVRPG